MSPLTNFRVLIASDQLDSARSLVVLLQSHGNHAAVVTFSCADIDAALPDGYDLLFIDLFAPHLDPLPTCKYLRLKFAGPILLMTHEDGERFHIRAYEVGVDEPITKPIGNELLLAKISAWLNRANMSEANKPAKHGFSVNKSNRRVITPIGECIRLSKLEFDLLCLFLDHPNRLLESRRIMDTVWYYPGIDADIEMEGLVKNLVYRLRRKIEPKPSTPQYIQTVPHYGYIFSLP